MLAERLLRGSELALEAARRDAADAMLACEELSERILALEAELVQARQEPERLRGLLASERRARRLAEQQAYAEQARREELQQELATEREDEQADPALDDHVEDDERRRELESEALALRRQADELGHLLGSARRGRERAERRVAELTIVIERGSAPVPDPTVSAGLAREFAVAAQPVPPNPPPAPLQWHSSRDEPDPRLALELRLVRARAEGASTLSPAPDADPGPTSAQLRAELAQVRANAERETAARLGIEARSAQLEHELSEQIGRSSRAYDAIEELRLRLGAIGGWSAGRAEPEALDAKPDPVPEEPAAEPLAAEPLAAEPLAAEPLAAEPLAAEPGPLAAGLGRPAVVVEPERFNAALTRLREAAPADAEGPDPGAPAVPAVSPPEPSPGPSTAWLPAVFRRLAREDPAAAGRLVLELLPAQRAVHPEPIAYDLVLPGQTCIRLTVADDGMRLELGEPRPPGEVRFAVTGDPASLARLLAAGRIGRWLRRGLPKVTGERGGLQALDALVSAPLSLRQLHDAGVRLEPRLALEVVARMIDPSWTSGPRFAIGYRFFGDDPVVYLEVGEGRSATVSEAVVPVLVAGTIAAEPESLLVLLDGGEPGAAEFEGDGARLDQLISWVKRAQSG